MTDHGERGDDLFAGELTDPERLLDLPRLNSAAGAEPQAIPSYTLRDAVCCNPRTQGCMLNQPLDVRDSWPSSPPRGCTEYKVCIAASPEDQLEAR